MQTFCFLIFVDFQGGNRQGGFNQGGGGYSKQGGGGFQGNSKYLILPLLFINELPKVQVLKTKFNLESLF